MSSRRQPADIDNDDDKMTLKKPITLEEWDAVPRWPCETCGHQNHATSSHCHECCPAVKFRQKMTEAFNAAELDQWIRETHGKRVPGAPWIPMGATRRPQWYEEYYLGINGGHARGLPAETTTTTTTTARRRVEAGKTPHKPPTQSRQDTWHQSQGWRSQEKWYDTDDNYWQGHGSSSSKSLPE